MRRGLIVLVLMVMATPAVAHTAAEQEAWLNDWILRSLAESQDPTIAQMEELADFASRHPGFLSPLPPPPTPQARQTSTTASKTAPGPTQTVFRGMGAGVEQWRGLVAFYWPADHVDRMLRIMRCESGGNPLAWNQSTDVRGLFQVRYPLWSKVWPGDYFDPWTNVAVAYQVWLEQGYRAWACKG